MGRTVVQYKAGALALPQREACHCRHPLAVRRHARAELERVGPGSRKHAAVRLAHPRHDMAVVEADHKFHAQGDLAVKAFDVAHDVAPVVRERHAVDDPHRAAVGLEVGLKDQRVSAVAPLHALHRGFGRYLPASVLRAAQQCREAGRRIEARHAEPVDRTIASNQRRRVAAADQGVVLYRQRHGVDVRVRQIRAGTCSSIRGSAARCAALWQRASSRRIRTQPHCRADWWIR